MAQTDDDIMSSMFDIDDDDFKAANNSPKAAAKPEAASPEPEVAPDGVIDAAMTIAGDSPSEVIVIGWRVDAGGQKKPTLVTFTDEFAVKCSKATARTRISYSGAVRAKHADALRFPTANGEDIDHLLVSSKIQKKAVVKVGKRPKKSIYNKLDLAKLITSGTEIYAIDTDEDRSLEKVSVFGTGRNGTGPVSKELITVNFAATTFNGEDHWKPVQVIVGEDFMGDAKPMQAVCATMSDSTVYAIFNLSQSEFDGGLQLRYQPYSRVAPIPEDFASLGPEVAAIISRAKSAFNHGPVCSYQRIPARWNAKVGLYGTIIEVEHPAKCPHPGIFTCELKSVGVIKLGPQKQRIACGVSDYFGQHTCSCGWEGGICKMKGQGGGHVDNDPRYIDAGVRTELVLASGAKIAPKAGPYFWSNLFGVSSKMIMKGTTTMCARKKAAGQTARLGTVQSQWLKARLAKLSKSGASLWVSFMVGANLRHPRMIALHDSKPTVMPPRDDIYVAL